MTYLPWLILGIVILIVGSAILIKLNNRGVESPFKYLLVVPGIFIVLIFGLFTVKTEELDDKIAISTIDTNTEIKNSEVDSDKEEITLDNDVRQTNLRLSNEFLMLNNPSDIYNKYSDEGKRMFDDIFLTDNIAKEFALTLIGKKIDGQLKTTNNLVANLNKGRYVVAILNQGEYSKKAVEIMNETKFYDGVDYLAYFPMDEKEDIDKFYKDNKLNERWIPISKQHELAIDELNVVGVPSFVSIEVGIVTMAINNYDLYEVFHKNAFIQDPLYNKIQE